MEPDHAIEIVQALADGVDPFTGERFPSFSSYQQADTVRALHLVLERLRLRLSRGKPYQVVLSRAPAGSGLSTNGFWWANVRFEAPPEFWGLNGPEAVVDGTLTYNAHTVHIETPDRPAYDLWRNPGTTHSPLFDLMAIRLRIDGPLIFCHNTTVAEIALTADSLVIGPVDWTGLPPVTPAQANPLVFDPSTVTPGAYTVVATDAGKPWGWATCQVEIHSLAFAESVVWLPSSVTNVCSIALAPGSFPTSNLDVWSEPAGITSLDITPSEIDPGSYTVYVWGECDGDEVQVNILSVGMTAYRPQTEGPGYGSPFQKHEVPEDKEESTGVGIRYNGDDDDGDTIVDRSDGSVAGENDRRPQSPSRSSRISKARCGEAQRRQTGDRKTVALDVRAFSVERILTD